MNKKKLFSVIILSYNNIQYMITCLESVLNQDYDYIEIVISDDFSDNLQIEKIEKYIKKNKKDNIKSYIINQNRANVGTVKNLNNAIKLANGNYFINLACDDLLYDKTVLTNVVKFFKNTNYLAVTGFIEKFYNYDVNISDKKSPGKWVMNFINNKTPIEIYKKLCQKNFLAGPGFCYKRDLINIYGFYDESYRLIEDYSRYLYLTRNGCKLGFINICIIKYRAGIGVYYKGMNGDINDEIYIQYNNDLDLIKEKEINPYMNYFK